MWWLAVGILVLEFYLQPTLYVAAYVAALVSFMVASLGLLLAHDFRRVAAQGQWAPAPTPTPWRPDYGSNQGS